MVSGRWLAALSLLFAGSRASAADSCRVLYYQFQPVPYDPSHDLPLAQGVPPDRAVFEEGGPQIAIWLETAPASGAPPAQRGSFVADLFVTNRTAQYGIGNRPGNPMFVSSPRFPYGARENVLPVWAWARATAQAYPALVMQDGYDDSFGFHESSSTPELFYCRPLRPVEIVDALTCPTSIFSSDKGMFDPSGRKSLYPPRHDVATCNVRGMCSGGGVCNDSPACPMLAGLDDVAAVSHATPSPFTNQPYLFSSIVPPSIPDGDYYIFVEVNKQYDQDAPIHCTPDSATCPAAGSGVSSDCPSYAPQCDCNARICERHPSFYDQRLLEYGLGGNIGQPSVVWATKVTILSSGESRGLADDYIGYGDWDQPRGNLFPPDATISTTPGSGAARLARITDSDGSWRFKVVMRGTADQATVPPPVENLTAQAPKADQIHVCFDQVGVGGLPVVAYEVRYKIGDSMSDADFATAAAGPRVDPGPPGTQACFDLTQHEGVQAQRTFTIGVRAIGDCMKVSDLRTVTVTTPKQAFATIEGCFIATAAYGSDMQPDVMALRRFRDRFLLPDPFGRALVGLYYAASPPLARAIRPYDRLRGRVRSLLRPEVEFAKAALLLSRPWCAVKEPTSRPHARPLRRF